MKVIEEVASERLRQREKEGWSRAHDDDHSKGEMAWAAACYAAPQEIRALREVPIYCGCREANCPHTGIYGDPSRLEWLDAWPFEAEWDKREKHGKRRRLVIAAALMVAEIERLDRATAEDATLREIERTDMSYGPRTEKIPEAEHAEGAWIPKESPPRFDDTIAVNGAFYTLNLDGKTVAVRYFDDSDNSWWMPRGRDGMTPNNSLTHWLKITPPTLG